MKLSANQAAKEAGIAKKTLLDALKTGRMSAGKNDQGHWEIDTSELFRVFPKTDANQSPEPKPTPHDDTENRIELARLQARLETLEDQLKDRGRMVVFLQEKLDEEARERRATQARLEDLRDRAAPSPPATTSSASVDEKRGFFSKLFR